MHSGMASQGVGSPVPVQSNSARNRSPPSLERVAVADHDRVDEPPAVLPDVEERRTLRRAQPLVGVRRVVGRAEAGEVERDHAQGVRPVDQRVDPARLELADEPLDREDEAGRARDVVEEREASARRHGGENRLDDLVVAPDRERDGRDDDPRAVTVR